MSVPSVRNKNGFYSISFENISVLDSNFIYRHIIKNVGQVRFKVKFTNYFGSYGPFSTLKNSFRLISFKHLCIGFMFNTQVYNHKIEVKFDHPLLCKLWPFFNFIFCKMPVCG